MVVVHAEGRYRLGMRGLKWIEIVEAPEARGEH
jgi:hypothetical protein